MDESRSKELSRQYAAPQGRGWKPVTDEMRELGARVLEDLLKEPKRHLSLVK